MRKHGRVEGRRTALSSVTQSRIHKWSGRLNGGGESWGPSTNHLSAQAKEPMGRMLSPFLTKFPEE